MLTTNQILQQGRYRIVSQLGQNGVGIGYEAMDTTSGVNVMLKEIRDNAGKVVTPSQLEARRAAFAEKANRLTEIKHESILAVTDFFSEVDHHYLVTEISDGFTLGDLLEKKKSAFSVTEAANWADNLLDALNYLHTQTPPSVHGEIKPQNLKLLPSGKIKLLIFNLVKPANETSGAGSGNQTFDAAALPYLPLEQIWEGLDAASKKVILTNYDEKSEKILEQPLDARSDVYSVAATLYHLLTARPPVDALTRSIDLLEGKPDPLANPSRLNQRIPAPISEVLMKALEIKRENRFSSAVIMRQVLRTASARAKELEVAGKQGRAEDDAVLEIPLSEQKPAEPKPTPKNAEMESEQARQLELIKRQLREAETRRLEAERRAAEAEKRLLEAEKHISIDPSAEKPAEVEAAAVETFAQTPKAPVESTPAPVAETPTAAASDYQSDEFSSLFAEPQKEGGALKKAAAAVVVLLVLAGGGFGVWTFMQPKTAQSAQSATTSTTMPQPTVEATPAPVTENAPAPLQATSETTPAPTDGQPTDATTASSNPAAKQKPVAATPTPQTAQVKKPAPTPAKQTDAPKKVTLDDLLKDN